MNLVEFTEELAKLVVNSDSLTVKEFETDEENTILIQIMVNNEEMPKLIGKGGKVIKAIRTLVQAKSFLMDNKITKIEVDSF